MKMTFKRALLTTVGSALLIIGAASSANAASGAWASQGYGTTMYQTNWWYWGSLIQPVGSIPTTAVISSVYWSVSSSPYYSTMRYRVCHNGKSGYCGETSSASGNTVTFSGLAANKPFQFGTNAYHTYNKSLVPTINVGAQQITVNYNY